ncbi:unnamed protein product [Allacma fusca]|uniref:Uncharacterized protein n=1 Tax=Allacma fusca TaxID=39272 RepID=A0A8J2KF77_9HEXA|nr:unnamed protein product [Allacma fusca]
MTWLLPFSAKPASAVDFALSTVRDSQRTWLLNIIQNTNIPSHHSRGYCMPKACKIEIDRLKSKTGLTQTWFILPGLGNQYEGMGRDLRTQ